MLPGRADFQRDGEPWFPFQESHGQLGAIQCGDTVLIIDLERVPRPHSAIHGYVARDLNVEVGFRSI